MQPYKLFHFFLYFSARGRVSAANHCPSTGCLEDNPGSLKEYLNAKGRGLGRKSLKAGHAAAMQKRVLYFEGKA